MHTFGIETRTLRYELNGENASATLTEFMIDGRALSDLLGIARDLGNSECDLDPLFQSHQPQISQQAVLALQARAPARNGLGSQRVVLYRCHCGSDDCGVISAQIQDSGDCIEWRDVGLETEGDGTAADTDSPRLPGLVFAKDAYIAELERFTAATRQERAPRF